MNLHNVYRIYLTWVILISGVTSMYIVESGKENLVFTALDEQIESKLPIIVAMEHNAANQVERFCNVPISISIETVGRVLFL